MQPHDWPTRRRQNRTVPIVSQAPPQPMVSPVPGTRRRSLHLLMRRWSARFKGPLLVAMGMTIAFGAFLLYDGTKVPPQRLTQRDINAAVARALETATPKPSTASVAYEIIRPSLVRIEAMAEQPGSEDDVSVGAGVVIDDAGLILASLHVVAGAKSVRVTFADGSESAAIVAISEPENDLVVLRPDVIPDDLVPATLTGSDTLRVGDEVIAVGNPFGISNSATAGVVSGLRRLYRSPKTGASLKNLIQFDAAVNPGNSGGPLVNRNGEVVGIVAALLNPSEQDVFIGIGFAVPIETAAGALGSPPF